MRLVALVLGIPLLLAGCSPELLDYLRQGVLLNPGQKPGQKPSQKDCYVSVVRPAPTFYLGAPATASAGVSFTVEPWVLLTAPVAKSDQMMPETFVAEVDQTAKRVTIRGSITRFEANPKADCGYPAIYMMPQAATVSVPVTLPAGKYELAIAKDAFINEAPQKTPYEPDRRYPTPQATRSLLVQ